MHMSSKSITEKFPGNITSTICENIQKIQNKNTIINMKNKNSKIF